MTIHVPGHLSTRVPCPTSSMQGSAGGIRGHVAIAGVWLPVGSGRRGVGGVKHMHPLPSPPFIIV